MFQACKGKTILLNLFHIGTTNTGAFDNLIELSSIARDENIWFHVDGAFGSLIILDPQRRHLVAGIEQADSLAFDFHKWLHCPYDAGCVLIRNSALLQLTFSTHRSGIAKTERDVADSEIWFCDLGPEVSRSFRALSIWFTLKEHGITKLGQKIAENCEQAEYLVSLLEEHNDVIRVVRPVWLNIVNFRFEPVEIDQADHELIDKFNRELVGDIQTSGIAIVSSWHIRNRVHIRVAILSHRSVREDFELFVETLLKLYQIRVQGLGTGRKMT